MASRRNGFIVQAMSPYNNPRGKKEKKRKEKKKERKAL